MKEIRYTPKHGLLAILIYWTDFPSGGESVKWVPLDLSSDGVHLKGSPPKRKSVQYIRRSWFVSGCVKWHLFNSWRITSTWVHMWNPTSSELVILLMGLCLKEPWKWLRVFYFTRFYGCTCISQIRSYRLCYLQLIKMCTLIKWVHG